MDKRVGITLACLMAGGALATGGIAFAAPASPALDLSGVSTYQQTVLKRGLTESTYRAAAEKTVECMRSQGIAASDPVEVNALGALSFTYENGGGLAEGDVPRIGYDCQTKYQTTLDIVWEQQQLAAIAKSNRSAMSAKSTESLTTYTIPSDLENHL